MGLLNISATSDTLHRVILLDRLHTFFSILGTFLWWIESFIIGRNKIFVVSDDQSTILSVLLFLLYTADVLAVVQLHRLHGHSYADDTAIYFSYVESLGHTQRTIIMAYHYAISSWMSLNRLKLNIDKTQFIWLGTTQKLAKVNITSITHDVRDICVSDKVTCLGILIDSQLTFADCMKRLTGNCFYQLWQL